MKKSTLYFFTIFFINIFNNAFALTADEFMDKNFAPVSDAIAKMIFHEISFFGVSIPVIILWALIGGIFFTIYFKGIPVWGFKHALDLVIKPSDKASGNDCGEVSSFQALATALSGTIGIGSIAGVAISISIGGPGAALWIFIGAFFGMSLKFVEAVLAVKYRRFNEDGSISGGPMHYIAHGLTRKKLRWLGQPLSVLYAILCIGGGITGGNMIQINQSAHQFLFITGGEHSFLYGSTWVFGLIVSVLVGMVTVGGIKSIAKITTVLVPTMCFMYIISGLIVIAVNFLNIPSAILLIIKEAFNPTAVAGGAIGTMVIGLRRSIQSNEAGTGAAAIVYATAQTKEPVTQGFVALLETFLTGVLCLFTSCTIIFTGACTAATKEVSGIELASRAFESVIPFFPVILSIIAILFALSTLISWAYYGQKAWTFLFGEGRKRALMFNLIYCVFIVIGSVMNVKSVINITDAMMVALCLPNIITLYVLCPEVKKDLINYCKKFKFTKVYGNEK